MEDKIYWIKYLSPLIGIIFCPITIVFLWTFWSSPVINTENDIVEEIMP